MINSNRSKARTNDKERSIVIEEFERRICLDGSQLIIDDFNTPQATLGLLNTGSDDSTVTGDMLGGTRFMDLFFDTTTPGTNAGAGVGSGSYNVSFNNGPGSFGATGVVYTALEGMPFDFSEFERFDVNFKTPPSDLPFDPGSVEVSIFGSDTEGGSLFGTTVLESNSGTVSFPFEDLINDFSNADFSTLADIGISFASFTPTFSAFAVDEFLVAGGDSTVPLVPFAEPDFFFVDEDPQMSLTFNATELLANDVAPTDASLQLTQINQQLPSAGTFDTTNGSLTFDPNTGAFNYEPKPNFFGIDTFTYTIESNPPSPSGPASGTVNIGVSPINDEPINIVPNLANVDEDQTLVFSGANSLSVSDVDAASNDIGVILTVNSGTLNVTVDGATVTNNDSGTVSLNGTVSQVNNSLAGLTYTPFNDFFGNDQLSVHTNDNGNAGGIVGDVTASNPLTDTDTVNITINPINDAPVLVVPGKQSFFTDFDNRFTPDPNPFLISDVDADDADVQLDLTIGDGTLTVDGTSSVTVSPNPAGNNGIRITGSISDITDVLNASLTYSPSASGDKSLSITINDLGNTGGGNEAIASESVEVEVLDFVPVDIQGQIFVDHDGNGQKESHDPSIQGVDVILSGTDFNGNPVNLSDTTDVEGVYEFAELRPNQPGAPYTITQEQPVAFQDGQGNNESQVEVALDGEITVQGDNLNFAESGFVPDFADLSRFLNSSDDPTSFGVLFGFHDAGQDWSIFTGAGWDVRRFQNARFTPNADNASGVLTVFDVQQGKDRTAEVSSQAGTLVVRGTSTERIFRVVGGSDLLDLPARIPGDADGDGQVAFADFLLLSANFGKKDATPSEGDFNGDSEVNFADFLILSKNFGKKGSVEPGPVAEVSVGAAESFFAQDEI